MDQQADGLALPARHQDTRLAASVAGGRQGGAVGGIKRSVSGCTRPQAARCGRAGWDNALDILTGLRAAEEAERLEPLESAICYIEGRRGWIGDYGAWRKLWLPVGSGLVELVINWRAKRRGMRWKRGMSTLWWRYGYGRSTGRGRHRHPLPHSRRSSRLLVEPESHTSFG